MTPDTRDIDPDLAQAIRARFAHVDVCPFEGPRVFFENAGGSLRLKSVIDTSALYAGYPDNQNRTNGASKALMQAIDKGRDDMALFFNADEGRVFVGESGTECLFRLIRTAALGAAEGGILVGSTLEHPATASAMSHWAEATGRPHVTARHDDAAAVVTEAAYRAVLTPDTRVVSIVHTSPVTGFRVDVAGVVALVRSIAPEAFVIVDGIQHASHGAVDVRGLDGYAVSPYKVFSRHGYGVGWASDRLTALPKEHLKGAAPDTWELGTRDAGSYATFSDMVDYLDWLGAQLGGAEDRRARIDLAGRAIGARETALLRHALTGTNALAGLANCPGVELIGPATAEGREGVICCRHTGLSSEALVEHLRLNGVRVHIRRNDHYCGNVLAPLGWDDCIRISISHYNTTQDVDKLLGAMQTLPV